MIQHLCQTAMIQVARFGLQSVLAIIGVAIGVANIILLISITDLGRRQASGLINEFGANLLIVTPYIDTSQGPLGGHSSLLSGHIPDRARAAVAGASEIVSVSGILLMPGHASHSDTQFYTTIQGVNSAYNVLRGHEVDQGRWLTTTDEEQRARVAVICDTVRRELFGEEDVVGGELLIKGERFTVIGTMEFKGKVGFEDVDNRVYIPLTTAQELFDFSGVHMMMVRYKADVGEDMAMEAVRRRLESALAPNEPLDETFSIFTIKEAQRLMSDTLRLFRTVLWGIASIALIVAGLGIMNVMLIRVMQRRQEIGIRRAVGATSGGIALQFLAESAIQAFLGAVAGTILGIVGVYLYCIYAEWTPYVNPWTVAGSVLFGIGTGLVFGGYPALRAAREDPIDALRRT